MLKSFLYALALLGLVLMVSVQAEPYAPRVGHQHPDLTLPRIDNGEALSLSGLRGKKLLLIHFASW